MHTLLAQLNVRINREVYLKDPESSELGRRIVTGSIDLVDEIGFENFTFRKLALAIGSTEASIYRYFENKHKLLLYLISWYWAWMEYRLVFALANVDDPMDRLNRALRLLTERVREDSNYTHINEVKLDRIVVAESSKAYLTKQVDAENEAGIFAGYKQLVQRVCDIIREINPTYKYPHMLVSTTIEGAHHQRFFAEHLPRLTDFVEGEDAIQEFCRDMVHKAIGVSACQS
ncbi:MAG: TetR/AcrR family transcriptional regulator [Bacteroidota bacterium]